jgi:hypothetical protein
MMKADFSNVEPMVYKSRISVPYHWWAGETASTFFLSLKNEKKISGTKCSSCGRVFLPPRKTCPTCFTPNREWVSVGPGGEVVSYTVVRRQLAALSRKVPVIFGLIKLDGAGTCMLHVLDEVKPEELKIGMRVVAKFSDKPKGHISDIEYFKPVK